MMPVLKSRDGTVAHDDLRHSLLFGDLEVAEIQPLLTQLLSKQSSFCFSDDILGHVRAMVQSLAADVCAKLPQDEALKGPSLSEKHDEIARRLLANPLILYHIHSLSLEGAISTRIEAGFGVSAETPAAMDELANGQDWNLRHLVLECIAAQTRFMSLYQRMELKLADLPPEICAAVMTVCATLSYELVPTEISAAARRHALFAELVEHPQFAKLRALDLAQAGFAAFTTGLARHSGQERGLVVMCVANGHAARILLSLKSLGVSDEVCRRNLGLLDIQSQSLAALTGLASSDAVSLLNDSAFVR